MIFACKNGGGPISSGLFTSDALPDLDRPDAAVDRGAVLQGRDRRALGAMAGRDFVVARHKPQSVLLGQQISSPRHFPVKRCGSTPRQ